MVLIMSGIEWESRWESKHLISLKTATILRMQHQRMLHMPHDSSKLGFRKLGWPFMAVKGVSGRASGRTSTVPSRVGSAKALLAPRLVDESSADGLVRECDAQRSFGDSKMFP
jgi:hypothetical protein